MQLREDLCLDTAIRALSEVVLPAVDPGNALALEQLQVVIGLLSLQAQRRALAWRYDLDELARLLPLCRALVALGEGEAVGALAWLSDEGERVLARAQAAPAEITGAVRALREASGALVTALYEDGDAARRGAVMKAVLAHAEAQLQRERAWLAPQGWEPRPETLPAIEDLLK